MSSHVGSPTPAVIRSGVIATYVSFIGVGMTFATWASRIPQVRDRLQLDPSQLGLVLLAIAAGSLIALPLSGPLVTRFGSRTVLRAMVVINVAGLGAAGVGYQFGVAPLAVGLFFFGFAQGAWDVAMNVQGALVERHLGRAIMPRFHAGFSAGTVLGALLGALMVALDVGVTVHLLVVGAVILVVVPRAVRGFLPDGAGAEVHLDTDGAPTSPVNPLDAWKEPRTLLIGLFVLAFAFAEGTGNDWTSIALIDGYQTSAAVGTLGFAAFLTAMTAGRWFGPTLLDRYGRVPALRALGVVSIVGVLIFVFGGSTPVAFVGVLLWGFGLSLGFPVGMSAGADEPRMAAARVSVVASVGYCAFLGGPPLVGFLGDSITVLKAVTSVAVLLAVAFMLTPVVRPLREPEPPAPARP